MFVNRSARIFFPWPITAFQHPPWSNGKRVDFLGYVPKSERSPVIAFLIGLGVSEKAVPWFYMCSGDYLAGGSLVFHFSTEEGDLKHTQLPLCRSGFESKKLSIEQLNACFADVPELPDWRVHVRRYIER